MPYAATSPVLVSTNAAGQDANNDSTTPVFSPDGGSVLFVSTASNLGVGGGTSPELWLKNLATGAVTLVSSTSAGAPSTGSSVLLSAAGMAFSPDGTQVIFSTDGGLGNGTANVYVKNLVTGALTSVGVALNYADSNASFSPVAGDTRILLAATNSGIVASNGYQHIYVKDLATGVYTLVDSTAAGVVANSGATYANFSGDATRVAFTSDATNLSSADTDSTPDVYVKTLSTGAVQLVSTNAAGVKANGGSAFGQLSPDGTKIAFITTATNLGYADAATRAELVVKDLASGATTLVSVGTDGLAGNGDTSYFAWSPDGTKIVFASAASNLAAGDANGVADIFVRDLLAGSTNLVSPAASNGASTTPRFSADSTSIVFSSAGFNFSAADTNGPLTDIYTAKLTPPAGPSVTAATARVNVVSGAATAPLEPALTVADGSGVISRVVVAVGGQQAGDKLAYTAPSSLTLTSDTVSGGTETLTFSSSAAGGASSADAQALLRSLAFSATGAAGVRNVSVFLADPAHAVGVALATTVVQVSAALATGGPFIIGGAATVTTADALTVSPFTSLTLSGPASSTYVTATVALSSSSNGALASLGSGTLSADGTTYTVAGSEAGVQAALRALVFTPAVHEAAYGASVSTGFQLTVASAAGSSTDARTAVTAIGSNTAPTITDTSAQQIPQPSAFVQAGIGTGSATSFQPFLYTTVADPDAGQTETLTITLAQSGVGTDMVGVLSGAGLTKTGAGTYTLAAASAGQVSAALQALAFTPVASQRAAGAGASLDVTLKASDGAASATATSTLQLATNPGGSTTVSSSTSTPTPAYTDTPASQAAHTYATEILAVLNGGAVVYDRAFDLPYSDPQVQAAVAQAQAALRNAGAVTTSSPALVNSATNLVSTQTTTAQTGSTPAAAAVSSLTFGPEFVGPNTYVATPGAVYHGYLYVLPGQLDININTTFASYVSRTVMTTTTDRLGQQYVVSGATTVNTPPQVGTVTQNGITVPITDKQTYTPFNAITFYDPDAGQTFTVTATYAGANGVLSGQGFTGSAGSYTGVFSSTNAATDAVRALVFTPTENQASPGQTITTPFTLAISDGQASASSSTAPFTIAATSINDAPALGGIAASQSGAAGAVTTPFASAVIGDVDVGQTETVTVRFAAGAGAFGGAGFTGSNGAYSGTFASAAAAQAALRAATFTPTAGAAASDVLTVSVQDAPNGTAAATSAATTLAVTNTAANTPPTITGAVANQADTAGAAITPFASVTVTDPDAGQTETVTVTFAAANGTLAGAGFTGAGGNVTGSFASAAAAQAALRSLGFTPTAGQSATTAFTVSVSDGQATATDSATSVVSTYTSPAGLGGGGTPVQPPSVRYGLLTEFQNLERALASGADALNPASPVYAAFQAERAIAAQLDSGALGLAQADAALAHLVDGTTGVAVASYAFFTGLTPTAAGLNYLVHSTANATDLNDAYYARFSTENRYINFAANLATGQGAGAFQAAYGSLSLADATAKAYLAVFGTIADAAKVSALLNTLVPDGLGGQETRAQYFGQYGGDGPNGQGTKAAMVGFLLSNAVHDGSGVYGAATENYLSALAHGQAPASGSEIALHYGAAISLVGVTPLADTTVTG